MSEDKYNYLNYSPSGETWFNKCTDKYDNERELFQGFQMEAYNTFGVELSFYHVSYDTERDRLWGEDNNRVITEKWDNVMSYFLLPKENKRWSKFGFEGINNFSIFVSKEHFRHMTNGYVPQMGDIIHTKYNNKFYEVLERKEETPAFHLSKRYAWELIVTKLKIEKSLSVSPELSAAPIAEFYGIEDILDIRNDVDIEKEDIKYKPDSQEKPHDDPFGV